MNIDEVTNAVYVGNFDLNTKNTKSNLKMNYNPELESHVIENNAGRVYLLTIDNVIYKIGGSQSKGGIKNTLAFYLSGNTGRPSIRSFGVNYHIIEALKLNKSVGVYMILSENVIAKVRGLVSEENVNVSPFKEMEHKCLMDYYEATGKYPEWNYQESNRKWPSDIQSKHVRLLESK
jgi:hypothetical protein